MLRFKVVCLDLQACEGCSLVPFLACQHIQHPWALLLISHQVSKYGKKIIPGACVAGVKLWMVEAEMNDYHEHSLSKMAFTNQHLSTQHYQNPNCSPIHGVFDTAKWQQWVSNDVYIACGKPV